MQHLSPGGAYQEGVIAPADPAFNPGVFPASALPQNPGLGISQGYHPTVRSPYISENEPGHSGSAAPYYLDSPSMTSSPRMFESPIPESHFTNPLNYTGAHTYPGTTHTYQGTTNTLGVDDWSLMDPRASRSPVSASSSIPQPWQPPQANQQLRNAFSPSGSEFSGLSSFDTPTLGTTSVGVYDGAQVNAPQLPMSFADQDAFELNQIHRSLETLPNVPRDAEGAAFLAGLEAPYLEAYWENMNPMFSIMHRPSFDSFSVSPLVKALMIAIGAHFLYDEEAQGVARCLREICTKLLHRVSGPKSTANKLLLISSQEAKSGIQDVSAMGLTGDFPF